MMVVVVVEQNMTLSVDKMDRELLMVVLDLFDVVFD